MSLRCVGEQRRQQACGRAPLPGIVLIHDAEMIDERRDRGEIGAEQHGSRHVVGHKSEARSQRFWPAAVAWMNRHRMA
jgi:hypothetical protein